MSKQPFVDKFLQEIQKHKAFDLSKDQEKLRQWLDEVYEHIVLHRRQVKWQCSTDEYGIKSLFLTME